MNILEFSCVESLLELFVVDDVDAFDLSVVQGSSRSSPELPQEVRLGIPEMHQEGIARVELSRRLHVCLDQLLSQALGVGAQAHDVGL